MRIDFRSWVKSHNLVPLLLLPASIAMFWVLPLVGVSGLIMVFLCLVARFDNKSGTFLPLAVLLVIILLVMALLVAGLAYIHAIMSAV